MKSKKHLTMKRRKSKRAPPGVHGLFLVAWLCCGWGRTSLRGEGAFHHFLMVSSICSSFLIIHLNDSAALGDVWVWLKRTTVAKTVLTAGNMPGSRFHVLFSHTHAGNCEVVCELAWL